MTSTVSYVIAASPERVVATLASATAGGSALGFSIRDATDRPLVGRIESDRSFTLRRARSFGTAPRILVLSGSIHPEGPGSVVNGRFRLHPAVRWVRAIWILLFIAFAVLVLPTAPARPELLWVVVVIGVIVGLMWLPFQWLAMRDESALRADLPEVLRRAGELTGRT